MQNGYSMDGDVIVINRELEVLDNFLKAFLEVLKKHSDYLVVSGYVSICSGRARGTEDVDILMPLIEEGKFQSLMDDLTKNNYWCYQGTNSEEIYPYLKNLDSIRFAKIDELYPNIELVPFNETKKAKYFEFHHPRKIRIDNFEFNIPPLEFEILYKEIVLKGKKDIEDAKHLRAFFSEILDEKKFKEYEPIILEVMK